MAGSTTINAVGWQNPNGVANGGSAVSFFTSAYGVLSAGNSTSAAMVSAAPGTAGQLYLSNGSSASPTFGTINNGLTWLASATASSSSSISFASNLSATYDNYLLTLENVGSTVNTVSLTMVLGTGAGPSYIVSGYLGTVFYALTGSAITSAGSGTASFLLNSIGGNLCTNVLITNANIGSGDVTLASSGEFFANTPSLYTLVQSGGNVAVSAAVTSIQLAMTSGVILQGIFKLYGITN